MRVGHLELFRYRASANGLTGSRYIAISMLNVATKERHRNPDEGLYLES